ncbi:MAG: hypothetical protein PVH22_13420 [Desulfobacteraceae bacterium]|jgi:hypothetical protein
MNQAKKIICVGIIVVSILTGYVFGHLRVDAYRSDYTYKLHAAAMPVPVELIGALAGEFKGLLADYLLLEAASFIGSAQSFDAEPEDWDAVARLLRQSNMLDPYFRSTYFLAHSILPWRAQKFNETLEILENSKNHLPGDWFPGFFLGFNHFFFLKDNLTASQKLMEASKIPGAPVYLATMAGRLAAEAGRIGVAIDFLTVMYEKSEDEQAREELKHRILALQGIAILESAVGRFQSQYGRMPSTLEELVSRKILPALPVNPYERPYTMKEGKVFY